MTDRTSSAVTRSDLPTLCPRSLHVTSRSDIADPGLTDRRRSVNRLTKNETANGIANCKVNVSNIRSDRCRADRVPRRTHMPRLGPRAAQCHPQHHPATDLRMCQVQVTARVE